MAEDKIFEFLRVASNMLSKSADGCSSEVGTVCDLGRMA
jgi:hypothetical protein